ncbi:iron reductase [Roseicella sp. DB1501]|uniref:iron reductase n=1 Tax=Roseicella sp. DB1501 TaxID=2730925 RepID=UPI001493079A|nr:iron reductase [Roseicella sp. DB1501]NOG73603.1 iron reductase [Roseicella sp. DB1501]
MNPRERLAVSLLVAMVALFAPGFLLHAAPRFPGSLAGGILGISGAVGMLLLLAYTLAKRVPWLRRRAALGAMLSFHVYAGAVGAALGMLHTGHQYRSPLGIALVSVMLVVVLSGFVGRYYLAQLGTDVRDQRQELGALRARYDRLAAEGAAGSLALLGPPDLSVRALVSGIADLEHAIGRREALRRALSRWTVLHVAAAIALCPLLALHIWSGIYYGLRWLR